MFRAEPMRLVWAGSTWRRRMADRELFKTGGGGGFITYMAMIPQQNVGAFIVVTRSPLTRFTNMSDGINDLVAELSGNKPQVIPAS